MRSACRECGGDFTQSRAAAHRNQLAHKHEGSEAVAKWECIICGFIYHEVLGDPDSGIAPGTRWEDIPDDWQCPDCGVGKADFQLLVD